MPPEIVLPRSAPRFDTEAETTHRRITWDDFLAEAPRSPGKRPARRGDSEQARISTAIESDPFDLKVRLINRRSPGGGQTEQLWVATPLDMTFYAVMDKQQSGVGRDARTELLLAHEQGHFDLTEIAARRLLESLAGIEGRGATGAEARTDALGKIQDAYERAVAELEEQQALYDLETSHGQSARRQRDWNQEIARRLAAVATAPIVEPATDQ